MVASAPIATSVSTLSSSTSEVTDPSIISQPSSSCFSRSSPSAPSFAILANSSAALSTSVWERTVTSVLDPPVKSSNADPERTESEYPATVKYEPEDIL